jgi:cytochrome c oxidase cbb3-type subunit 4
MSIGLIQAIWTVLALVIFVGIVIWAWSDNRKDDFEKAARMALDDDESPSDNRAGQDSEVRGHHG